MAHGRWVVGPFRGYQNINGYEDSPSVMTQGCEFPYDNSPCWHVWILSWHSRFQSPSLQGFGTPFPIYFVIHFSKRSHKKTRPWLLFGWFVWYIIPPPSRYQVGMVDDYTYIYLLYSGILCTRISYLRTGFRLGRLSKSARGVVTQDRVLRGTLGQICQHAPMVNAPVTVERFLAPWRWAERINMRGEKPIIMISMYPDIKFRRILGANFMVRWMVCKGLHSVESRVWGFVHALKIPSKCHMSSEQWAADRLMLCDWGKNTLTSQKTNGGKPTTPVVVGCCPGCFFLIPLSKDMASLVLRRKAFRNLVVEVVANMQENIWWVWRIPARFLDLQACNCSTKGSDLTFCTMLQGWLTCSLLAHLYCVLFCIRLLWWLCYHLPMNPFSDRIYYIHIYTQFPHVRM